MNWHDYDEKLIRRGELILDLEFVRNYPSELDAMNRGKEGKPFKLTDSYVRFLAVVRYLYGMPYRQLEGFPRPGETRQCPNRGLHLSQEEGARGGHGAFLEPGRV